MSRIRVDPEELREIARQMAQASTSLNESRNHLSRSWARLGASGWYGRHRGSAESHWSGCQSQVAAVAGQLSTLSQWLYESAAALEEADQHGVLSMERLQEIIGRFQAAMLGAIRVWGIFSAEQRDALLRVLRLGSFIGGAISLPVLPIIRIFRPAIAMASPPIRVERPIDDPGRIVIPSPYPPWLQKIIDWIADWIGRHFGPDSGSGPSSSAQGAGQPTQIGTPVEAQPVASASTEPVKPGEAEQVAKGPEQPPKAAEPPQERWWADVPLQSQQGLKLPDGTPTAWGCGPTCVSMILEYWHARDPDNKTVSAQDLVTENYNEGRFRGVGGMSVTNIHDEITDLGYKVVEDKVNASEQDLREAVAQGPVIAVVKLGMQATGVNHSVVVTGISADRQVHVNDPWDGKEYTYSWEQFSKSWGADFGQNAPKNNFTIIRPS